MAFPVAAHDDMLDALARIENMHLKWPAAGVFGGAHRCERPTSYLQGRSTGDRLRARHRNLRKLTHPRPNV